MYLFQTAIMLNLTDRSLFFAILEKMFIQIFNPYMKVGAARAKVVQRGAEER
jgi:hypothetical protein